MFFFFTVLCLLRARRGVRFSFFFVFFFFSLLLLLLLVLPAGRGVGSAVNDDARNSNYILSTEIWVLYLNRGYIEGLCVLEWGVTSCEAHIHKRNNYNLWLISVCLYEYGYMSYRYYVIIIFWGPKQCQCMFIVHPVDYYHVSIIFCFESACVLYCLCVTMLAFVCPLFVCQ